MSSCGVDHYKNTGTTEADVLLMREAWALHKFHAAEAKKYNATNMAKHFDISKGGFYQIVRNVTWKHILTQ